MEDRIVFGARCTWWDSIDKATVFAGGLPVCPFCGSPLFECKNIEVWQKQIDNYDADGNDGYAEMMDWARGKCFSSFKTLEFNYLKRFRGHEPIPFA